MNVVIENSGMDSKKVIFLSIYIVYKDNNYEISVATSTRVTHTLKRIYGNDYFSNITLENNL